MRGGRRAALVAGLAATLVAGCGGGGSEKKADAACAKAADTNALAIEAHPTIYGRSNAAVAEATAQADQQELARLSALKAPSGKQSTWRQYLGTVRAMLAVDQKSVAVERKLAGKTNVTAQAGTPRSAVNSERAALRQRGFALASKLGFKDCAGGGGTTRDSDEIKQVNTTLQTTNKSSNCTKYMTRSYVTFEFDNLASCRKQVSSPQGLGKPPTYPRRAQIVGSTGILLADYHRGQGAPGTPLGRWTFFFFKAGGQWKVQGQHPPGTTPPG